MMNTFNLQKERLTLVCT